MTIQQLEKKFRTDGYVGTTGRHQEFIFDLLRKMNEMEQANLKLVEEIADSKTLKNWFLGYCSRLIK